jgi:hypothetical protein
LSHSASFHSFERITPSNLGIKHLAQRRSNTEASDDPGDGTEGVFFYDEFTSI